MKDDAKNHQFVVGGHNRAVEALEPGIRAQVEGEFTERLKNASFWRQIRVRREITVEVKRRIHQQAPPDALY